MKVVHVTAHLGGGIGKAHAAISSVLPEEIKQTFVLLEKPIDQRWSSTITSLGGNVIVADSLKQVAAITKEADIVQFEFTNHPRLMECLARTDFAPMRSVIWAHISGLFQPVIPPKLMDQASRFVFSSDISMPLAEGRTNISVINSGFGFLGSPRIRENPTWPRVAYLGTVSFVKMHSGFLDIVDRINHVGPVMVWGHLDKAVKARASKMKKPNRVEFLGATMRPEEALRRADIFLYPLQRNHYGTGENSLVEAMSIGLVPIVMNNAAESRLVTDHKTGLVVSSIDECVEAVDYLLSSPTLRKRLSANAMRFAAEEKVPQWSARAFVDLWEKELMVAPKQHDFKSAIGNAPIDWFYSTHGTTDHQGVSKGSLAHFKAVFPNECCV